MSEGKTILIGLDWQVGKLLEGREMLATAKGAGLRIGAFCLDGAKELIGRECIVHEDRSFRNWYKHNYIQNS